MPQASKSLLRNTYSVFNIIKKRQSGKTPHRRGAIDLLCLENVPLAYEQKSPVFLLLETDKNTYNLYN